MDNPRTGTLPREKVSNIFNLSKFELNAAHMKVLQKGLKFIPFSPPQEFDFTVDFYNLTKKMQWRTFFAKSEKRQQVSNTYNLKTYPTKLKDTCRGEPPIHNASIDVFKRLVLSDTQRALTQKKKHPHNNLSKQESKALKELTDNDDIIIKRADKGGGTVIMDKSAYIAEAERQLSDHTTYQKLSKNPSPKLQLLIEEVLTDAVNDNIIDVSTKTALTVKTPRTPVLYLLPKIHKDLVNPPGRPIVSGTGSVLQALAMYIDQFLQPIVKKLPRCLKDTGDFLNQISTLDLADTTYIGSFDVVNLYTSIPHTEGLHCIRDQLTLVPSLTNRDINFLLSLLEIVLTENFFRFNNEFFLQIKGCAMGSSVAPSLANIFMSAFEDKFIFQDNPHHGAIKCWLRYVDDVFFLWTRSKEELEDFLAHINTVHPTIKFTLEYDTHVQKFLDVMVTRRDHQLETSIFRKPTDVDNTLLRSSYHPPGVFRGILTGHLLRLKRIITDETMYVKKSLELASEYAKQGYPKKEIDTALEVASKRSRASLLERKPPVKGKDRLIFTCNYGPHIPMLRQSIRKHWEIIKSDPNLKDLFPETPTLVFKKGKSISNFLVRGDITPHTSQQVFINSRSQKRGTFPCLHCTNCASILKGVKFKHPLKDTEITARGHFTCNTTGAIYLLQCPCGLAYVGQTSRHIKTRLNEHKSVIRTFLKNPGKTEQDSKKKKETTLAKHFAEHGHTISDLKWRILETVNPGESNNELKRNLLKRETYWIHTLGTLAPQGLNEECLYGNAL